MTAFSPETRRLLELSRHADDPAPSREGAVRDRLIGKLGVAAMTGAAVTSAAAGAVEAATASSTGVISGGTTATGAGASHLGFASVTTALAKTIAGVIVVAGIRLGPMNDDARPALNRSWTSDLGIRAERIAKRTWRFISGSDISNAASSKEPLVDASVGTARHRHELLIEIARRPGHPVAKEAELVLILRAERSWETGDVALTARHLDEHATRFPEGALSDHREALRVLMDCGKLDDTRRRESIDRFTRRFPDSDQRERIAACAVSPSISERESPATANTEPPNL